MVQWAHRQTGDAVTEARLLADLNSLLTDANARPIFLSLSPDERDSPFGLAALEHWLKVDQAAAAAWMAAEPAATERQTRALARQLVDDPATLEAFCVRLPDTPWKQTFLFVAGLEALTRNDAEVAVLAGQMNAGPAKINLLQTAANEWAGLQ